MFKFVLIKIRTVWKNLMSINIFVFELKLKTYNFIYILKIKSIRANRLKIRITK